MILKYVIKHIFYYIFGIDIDQNAQCSLIFFH